MILFIYNLDIKFDLFDNPSYNNESLNKKKFGIKTMDNFLEKFGNDKFENRKIYNVDKNKMFLDHFKNRLPKMVEN